MAELLSMESKRNNEKQKALDSALAQIERQFGKGSIMKLGADNPVQEIKQPLQDLWGWILPLELVVSQKDE